MWAHMEVSKTPKTILLESESPDASGRPAEASPPCSGDEEVMAEVPNTVVYEVAHHFGIDDDALAEMGV